MVLGAHDAIGIMRGKAKIEFSGSFLREYGLCIQRTDLSDATLGKNMSGRVNEKWQKSWKKGRGVME